MQRRYAVYRKDCSFICDLYASSEQEALAKAKIEDPDAETIILIVPGNDLGVNGLHYAS